MRLRRTAHDILSELAAFKSVFNARSIQLRRAQLPAVRIFVNNDALTNDHSFHNLGWYVGTCGLSIQVIVESGSDPETADILDVLCSHALHALFVDPRWNRMARVSDITTDITLDDSGEMRTATASILMSVEYTDCMMRDYGTWGEGDDGTKNPEGAADFKSIRFGIDVIDPAADPNTAEYPNPPNVGPPHGYEGGYPGPDGRIEIAAEWVFPPPDEDEQPTAPQQPAP